jgi:hypothetical protein
LPDRLIQQLTCDHTRWISTPTNFFLSVTVLSPVFRDKFVEGLEDAFQYQHLLYSASETFMRRKIMLVVRTSTAHFGPNSNWFILSLATRSRPNAVL